MKYEDNKTIIVSCREKVQERIESGLDPRDVYILKQDVKSKRIVLASLASYANIKDAIESHNKFYILANTK